MVVKQIRHESCDYYQFGNKLESELRDYGRLCEIGIPMPKLLAVDMDAERIVKEYVDGKTVYQMVAEDALPETCMEQWNFENWGSLYWAKTKEFMEYWEQNQ